MTIDVDHDNTVLPHENSDQYGCILNRIHAWYGPNRSLSHIPYLQDPRKDPGKYRAGVCYAPKASQVFAAPPALAVDQRGVLGSLHITSDNTTPSHEDIFDSQEEKHAAAIH